MAEKAYKLIYIAEKSEQKVRKGEVRLVNTKAGVARIEHGEFETQDAALAKELKALGYLMAKVEIESEDEETSTPEE